VAREGGRGATVFLPGFRQIEELPRFYGTSDFFIHPATSEPWGLVVNEAMASRLPVLASTGTGAAADLVVEGVNGWIFNPGLKSALSELMIRVADLSSKLLWNMGEASWQTLEERCPLEAFGRGLAAATQGRPSRFWDQPEHGS
jgi:glycosyltransferase involved in cell wall biosynthesis